MTLYILTAMNNDKFKQNLERIAADVVYLTKPSSLSQLSQLKNDDEKILVIDPDFVEWDVSRQDLESVKNLKSVLVSSTSFGWVDQSFLNENGIPLVNITDWCTQAVAEYALMMALNLARKIPLLIKDGFPLDYNKYCGVELKGRTAGIVGMGNIGRALADRLIGLGMNVIYWSKSSNHHTAKRVELPELFSKSDFVFPTMADNTETQSIISNSLLSELKQESYFISIVHKYYDHNLLLNLVKNGDIAGYGFEDSKTKMSDYSGNVWVAPEYAWCTKESFLSNDAKLLENIELLLKSDFTNKVN